MTRTRGRRRSTCHHEAGHAVARWWLGFHVDSVEVLSGEQLRAAVGLDDEGEERFDAEGIVTGYAIPFKLDRATMLDGLEGDERDRMDREGARRVDMALIASAAGIQAEAAYRRQSSFSCFLAGGGGDRENARFIAALWLDDAADQAAAFDRADKIARDLARSYKGRCAVRLVADALHARGRIDGDEVDALCATAYGASFSYDRWADAWPPTDEQIRSGFLPPRELRQTA